MKSKTQNVSNTNLSKALQLAATAKSNALVYTVLAGAISRNEDVDVMCESLGMRYGQFRLLAAGDHEAPPQGSEFYMACASYIGCSALTAKILARALRADDFIGGDNGSLETWQEASNAADKLAICALRVIADTATPMQTYQIPCNTISVAREH